MLKEFFSDFLGFVFWWGVISIILTPILVLIARVWWWLAKNAWNIAIPF